MKVPFKDIIGIIMLVINTVYWVILIGIADSLSMAGAILGFCVGVCLVYLTKVIFEHLDIISKNEN